MGNTPESEKGTCVTPGLETGIVRVTEGSTFLVEIGDRLWRAECAISCLIAPERNDRVLVYHDTAGIMYILSILQRQSEMPASMPFEHGLSLKVRKGALNIESPDIRCAAARELNITGSTLKLRAHEGTAFAGNMNVEGFSLSGRWETVNFTARSIFTLSERLIQKCKRCYRTVEEFEENRIGRLRLMVKNSFFLKSKKASVRAEEDVRIDGEKILLG